MFKLNFLLYLGIADAITLLPSIGLLREYFDRHLGLAIGLSHIGSGIGQLIAPRLFLFFIDQFGLKGTLLLWGGIQLHLAVCAMILRPTSFYSKKTSLSNIQQDEKQFKVSVITLSSNELPPLNEKQAETIPTLPEALKTSRLLFHNRKFTILNVAIFALSVAYFSTSAFLMPALASDIGLSTEQAGLLITAIGAGTVFGRPAVGWASDRNFISPAWLLASVCIVDGILLCLIPNVGSSMPSLATLSVLIGVTTSTMFTLPPTILRDIVSKEQYTLACGWTGISMGIPSLFANPLFGKYSFNTFILNVMVCNTAMCLMPDLLCLCLIHFSIYLRDAGWVGHSFLYMCWVRYCGIPTAVLNISNYMLQIKTDCHF